MDEKSIAVLVIGDFIGEKMKKLSEELGVKEEELAQYLEKEIREISLYMIKQAENNLRLEFFNRGNLEKIFKDGLNSALRKSLNGFNENIRKENLLIQKFEDSLSKGDIKAISYYILINKLVEKDKREQTNMGKEVIIH